MEQQAPSTSYGQVIEYIKDRLYLASYTHPPTTNTPFPYTPKQSRSPTKRSSRTQTATASRDFSSTIPVYFSIDKYLLYNAFYADFGPLHIGHLYRFAVQLHEVLGDPENTDKPVVFWSSADSRSRANAACILACYMVLIQSWPPHLALAPIAQMDPPLMPFRDAGYSQADYVLNVQDVVYGVWRAKEEGLVGLKDFNLEEYERYERVDMGDFNWVAPSFVAFASPQHQPIEALSIKSPEYAALPKTVSEVYQSDIPGPFKNVLAHFKSKKVGLVVRLNSELYSPSYFEALGMTHLDMIFDDGTCPPLTLVKNFISLAHEMITVRKKSIAVHCKAGLGRTGCLIGAYLIYRHGFTANEVIAYMRFMRPGMVVGPQQHWLHLNQGTFREWWFEDSMKEKLAALRQATPPKALHRTSRLERGHSATSTPTGYKRRALGELDYNEQSTTSGQDDVANLPAPTPGQPRKTSKLYGTLHNTVNEDENSYVPETEIVAMQRHTHTQGESESEEEFQLRMLARHRSSTNSRSPDARSPSHKKRAVSYTTTTTTTTTTRAGDDAENEQPTARGGLVKTPNARSGSGVGALSVGKRSATTSVSRSSERSGVRKTSGRTGSVGTALTAATANKSLKV